MILTHWTVDFGAGPNVISVPHCWGQDEVDVRWEGPAIYRTEFVAEAAGEAWIHFHAVSAWCEVTINGNKAAEHLGIWDAFLAPFEAEMGQTVSVEVKVIKNGGATYPVNSLASGFLPYVYHTFGGIYDAVEVHYGTPPDLEPEAPASPVEIIQNKISLDGKPTYIRGLLHWGWYPEAGHPRPSIEVFRKELDHVQALGFNLVKFCLWVPSHEFLEEIEARGMWAWMEMPVWFPKDDSAYVGQISLEIDRIVKQYRRHRCIIAWTAGCELGTAMPFEVRKELVQKIISLTGCPLVKDSSGGAEMYGGDPREAGTFEDFHPYCDLTFFPTVLDQLAPGPRRRGPILFGEYNDFDCHRDLKRLLKEQPFWISEDPSKNDIGVRWQHDLPSLLPGNRFALGDSNHEGLMESSRTLKQSVHYWVNGTLRLRGYAAGVVITGWRDTPISSSGIFDDWGQPRFRPEEFAPWNGPMQVVMIPQRSLPWVRGGNRPMGPMSMHRFPGPIKLGLGVHSEQAGPIEIQWAIFKEGKEVASGSVHGEVEALVTTEVGTLYHEYLAPGRYDLLISVPSSGYERQVNFLVTTEFSPEEIPDWELFDPDGRFDDIAPLPGTKKLLSTRFVGFPGLLERPTLLFIQSGPILRRPFLREACYLASPELPDFFVSDAPSLRLIASDCALDPAQLPSECTPLISRIDVRTYEELWVAARYGPSIISTLSPYGGFWNQPPRVLYSPVGTDLLRMLIKLVNRPLHVEGQHGSTP